MKNLDQLFATKKMKAREKFEYVYRSVIPLPIMSFMYGVNGAARCGTDALKLNALITAQIQSKRLKFNVGGQEKKQMHENARPREKRGM